MTCFFVNTLFWKIPIIGLISKSLLKTRQKLHFLNGNCYFRLQRAISSPSPTSCRFRNLKSIRKIGFSHLEETLSYSIPGWAFSKIFCTARKAVVMRECSVRFRHRTEVPVVLCALFLLF